MIQISAPLAGWPNGSEVIGQVWRSQAEHAGTLARTISEA
jgi:hypothetical protein